MGVHKEFENAGKKPGLQVWRVVKMDLESVMLPELPEHQLHIELYTGDAYIVLKINSPGLSYQVHTWIGKEATVDEKGSAPIYMMQLDEYLGSKGSQYSEFEDEESSTFLGYFKAGVTYKKGGAASGFKTVPDENIKRLLHVKGRHNIRATEKPFSWQSFNKGDSFLIDLGETIYLWAGSDSNHFERFKATDLAISIRDGERGGRPKITSIEEGSEPEEVLELLGPKPDLPSSTSADRATDKKNRSVASLYLISDAAGSMETSEVAKKNPFQQDMLSDKDCYILDNVGGNTIFVWKGKKASKDERSAALAAANKFIKEKNYPSSTNIQVMASGAEDAMFKQFFVNWIDKYETTGPKQPARLFACSNKTGSLVLEEVPGRLTQLDLATDDVMILDCEDKLFIWVGKDANEDEKTGSSKMAKEYLDSDPSGRKGIPITTMQQGEEISSFTTWFPDWDPKLWDKDLLQYIEQKIANN